MGHAAMHHDSSIAVAKTTTMIITADAIAHSVESTLTGKIAAEIYESSRCEIATIP